MAGVSSLFRAQVVDTQTFKSTGKIHVHVFGYTVENTYAEAEVLTPFGGLPNMGIQAVPPIGAIGFVLFERTQRDMCVWVGSVLTAVGNQFEIYKDAVDEGYGNPVEAEKPEDFIIKTQHTKFDDRDTEGKTNRVENIIKMNEKELTLAKVNQADDTYEYQKEAYDISPTTNPNLPYNVIQITDEGITIKYKPTNSPDDNYMTMSLTEAGLQMKHKVGNEERTLDLNEEGISIDAKGNGVITIKNDGTVVVEAKEIQLGGDTNWATLYEGFRSFVNDVFMNHQHGSACGGTKGIVIAKPDTTIAKSKKVKLS